MARRKQTGKRAGTGTDRKLRLGFLVKGLLGGSLDHYGNELDKTRKPLLGYFYHRLFEGVTIEDEKVEKLRRFAKKGRLIYAFPYRSPLDFFFFHTMLRHEGLPTPEIVHNTNVYRFQPLTALLRIALSRIIHVINFGSWPDPFQNKYYLKRYEEEAGFVLNLEDASTFVGRLVNPIRDPLYHLIKLHKKHGETVIVIPIFPVFEKGPAKEGKTLWDALMGSRHNPGRLRKIIQYLRYSGQAFVEVGDPITIDMFLERPDQRGLTDEQAAFNLRKELWEHTVREQRVIRGPVQKPRTQMMETVLRSPEVLKVMRSESKAQGKTFRFIRKKGAHYVNEIAANYRQSTIAFLDTVLSWVWRTMFDGLLVDEKSLVRTREAAKRCPVVYVPSHKSHIDYLVLSWVLYNHNMVTPHIVAGVNLNTWPIGPIFRQAGAFFMRRTFKGNPLYGAVFTKYLEVLIREGYNLEFFIEGGRSRTGRLLMPKMGIVKIIVDCFERGAARDIMFVPIYIGYDQIIEEGEYLEEMHGDKNPKGNLIEMIKNFNLIRRRYGKIYVNFAKPISLRRHLEAMSDKVGDDPEQAKRMAVEELCGDIVQGINRNQIVTPYAIMAAALLTSPHKGIGRSELLNALALYYQYLVDAEAMMTDSLGNVTKAIEDVIAFYEDRKLIEVEAGDDDDLEELAEPIYTLPEDNRLSLEMYKNMILHHFLPMSFITMSLLSADYGECPRSKLIEDYRFFKDLFDHEFIHDERTSDEDKIERCLKFLELGRHVEVQNGDGKRTYQVTVKGREEMVYFAAMITNFLEAYGIALNGLSGLEKKPATEKELLGRLKKAGQRLYKQGAVLRPEALSQLLFKNAIKWSIDSGMVIPEARDGKYPTLTLNPSADDHRNQLLTMISKFIRVEKYHYLEK